LKGKIGQTIKKMLTKEQVFTIPNALCFLRILIIPLIVWGFFFLDVWYSHYITAGIIIFSALLDVIDGKIARKFNMVTDFGKAIDPIADKLTQVTIATCLAIKYVLMRALVVLFVLKEIVMLIMGLLAMRKGIVKSAKWFGKLNTVILFLTMSVMVFFPKLPPLAVNIMTLVAMCSMIATIILYVIYYIAIIYGKKNDKTSKVLTLDGRVPDADLTVDNAVNCETLATKTDNFFQAESKEQINNSVQAENEIKDC